SSFRAACRHGDPESPSRRHRPACGVRARSSATGTNHLHQLRSRNSSARPQQTARLVRSRIIEVFRYVSADDTRRNSSGIEMLYHVTIGDRTVEVEIAEGVVKVDGVEASASELVALQGSGVHHLLTG